MAYEKFFAPLNGQNYIQKPYVDDIFDPLFNAEVKNYYESIYGPGILGRTEGILSGYGQMWENALTGKKGILGPGMGILGTFGRSMDKADDFILGGLTEGVNLLGSGLKGSNDPASNPIKNIFVNDQDYSGTRLLAAMGNAMAGMTGNPGVKLDQKDFNTLGDKGAGIVLDLATDPGIAGSQLARLNKATPVGEVGSFLNEYDNIMADVAGNMALPGLKSRLGKSLHYINDKLSANTSADLTNTNMGKFVGEQGVYNTNMPGPTDFSGGMSVETPVTDMDITLSNMADDLVNTYKVNPIDDPEVYSIYEEIQNKMPSKYKVKTVDPAEFQKHVAERNMHLDKASSDLETISKEYKEAAQKNAFEGINKHPNWFGSNTSAVDVTYDWDSIPKEMKAAIIEDEYGLPYNEANAFITPDEKTGIAPIDEYDGGDFFDEDTSSYYDNEYKHVIEKRANEDSWKYAYNKSPVKFTHSTSQMNLRSGKQQLDIVYDSLEDFLEKHPEGLNNSYFRNTLGIKTPENVKEALDELYSATNQKQYWHKAEAGKKAWYGYDKINANGLSDILNSLKKQSIGPADEITESGLIPWIRQNEATLQKTKFGQDLISLADTLDDKLFTKTSPLIEVSTSEGGANIVNSFTREMNAIFNGNLLFKDAANNWLPEAQIKTNLEDFAKDFNHFELNVSKDLSLEDSKIYQDYIDKYYTPTRKANYPYPYTTITPRNIRENMVILKGTYDKKLIEVSRDVAKMDTPDFVKYVTEPTSIQSTKATTLCNDLFTPFKEAYGLPDMDPEELGSYIRKYGSPEEQKLFTYFNAATENSVGIKVGARSGTMQVPIVQRAVDKVKQISSKHDISKIKQYQQLSDARQANIVKGNEMLSYLVEDGKGLVEIPLNASNKTAMTHYNNLKKTLTANINKVNSAAGDNILVLIDKQTGNTKHLGYALNWENDHIIDSIKKVKNLELTDMTFKPAVANVKMPDEFKEIDDAFEDVRTAYSSLATKLNLPESDLSAMKHVGADTPEATKYWEDYITNEIGLTKYTNKAGKEINIQDNLERMVQELQKTNLLPKGRFGTVNLKRYTLGNIAQYGDNYTSDLNLITSSTFTKGVFDNTNTQTFAGMFLSDNFAVNKNFGSVDDLQNAFFTKDGSKLTGNIANTELISPKYNELGTLVGFKKYNKLNRADLEKAFKDDSCILVPDFTVDTLDKICKNEIKADNKVISFINKYFTTPFKLGTLANPGFIVGNVEDAYFKQAVEFSRKYGTNFVDEASNVAMSMRKVVILNNTFEDKCMNPLREFLSSPEATSNPVFRKWTSDKVAVTPELISKNPEARKMFSTFINNGPLDAESRKVASLYLYISGYQDVTLNKFNKIAGGTVPTTGKGALKDADSELQNALGRTEFSSKTPINRILYGSPDKNGKFAKISDQGLINNWYSKGILDTSNDIETMMRSATVINELEHKGYDLSEVSEILTAGDKTLKDKLRIDMIQALNTMNSANFNYDKASEFLNKASYVLPFPTFYLKNMAYWADIFVNKPQIIDNTISVHEGMWSGKDTKDEFVAEAKGRGAVPFGQQFKHLTGIAKQSPYNSMFGAFNAFNNTREDVAYRINPVARPLTRHLQNPEDVKYRPYSTNQYEKNIKMGDKQFSDLAYMFHQLNPYERFMNTYLRTPGKIARNEWQTSDILPSVFQPDFKK